MIIFSIYKPPPSVQHPKKKVIQKTSDNPFDIRDGRAMVSLGPLSPKKYCTYTCPFCYVNAGFLSYATKSIDEILSWLFLYRDDFDIIYISGDTDSFAPPRTAEGIRLLKELSEFGVDLLFTTRAIFTEDQLLELYSVRQRLSADGKMLFGCVSIAQLHHDYLEPKPIASPIQRIQQLSRFKEMGLVSIHALRPFLPHIPVNEYLELLDLVQGHVDIVLGEVWYADKEGLLERATFPSSQESKYEYLEHVMDFDENRLTWKVYESKEAEMLVSKKCLEMQIPFFMRSAPAITWARKNFKL